jgi:4-hydroxy-2-oxoheptanedioate aldolase
MIETEEGLDNAEAILAVDGVDAVFIGPTDLSLSFGVARDDPANDERVMALKGACDRAGKPAGVAATSVDEGRRRAASGFAFIAVPSDAVLLRQAYGAFLESVRSM